jgi:hypothetical protein
MPAPAFLVRIAGRMHVQYTRENRGSCDAGVYSKESSKWRKHLATAQSTHVPCRWVAAFKRGYDLTNFFRLIQNISATL